MPQHSGDVNIFQGYNINHYYHYFTRVFFFFFSFTFFFSWLDSFFFSGASPVLVWCLGSDSPPQHPRLHIPSSIISTLSPSHTFPPRSLPLPPAFLPFSLSPPACLKILLAVLPLGLASVDNRRQARRKETREHRASPDPDWPEVSFSTVLERPLPGFSLPGLDFRSNSIIFWLSSFVLDTAFLPRWNPGY